MLSRRLYISNINDSITEVELRNLFSSIGDVTDFEFGMNRRTGERDDYAYIEMSTVDEATRAQKTLDSKKLKDTHLIVMQIYLYKKWRKKLTRKF